MILYLIESETLTSLTKKASSLLVSLGQTNQMKNHPTNQPLDFPETHRVTNARPGFGVPPRWVLATPKQPAGSLTVWGRIGCCFTPIKERWITGKSCGDTQWLLVVHPNYGC